MKALNKIHRNHYNKYKLINIYYFPAVYIILHNRRGYVEKNLDAYNVSVRYLVIVANEY